MGSSPVAASEKGHPQRGVPFLGIMCKFDRMILRGANGAHSILDGVQLFIHSIKTKKNLPWYFSGDG